MTAPAVLVEELRMVAGGRTILDVDALSVSRSEVLAVLGPNGAGKTSLLTTCLGLRRPSSGRVTILGQIVFGGRRGISLTNLRRRIGYVPQQLAAHANMPLTVREIVAIGRTGLAGLLRSLRRADWRIIDEWIGRLGLEQLRDARYADLSGGEQRKVLIARAMVQQPEILMLDEPTAHLDLGWREQIVATLEQLYQQTRPTVLLVCHELEVLPPCCRRLVLLDHGRIAARGSPADVLTAERIARIYGPGLRLLHDSGRHAVVPVGEGRV